MRNINYYNPTDIRFGWGRISEMGEVVANHMNIEEKSFYEATKLAGDKLIHYHLCENDRGIPGTGLVDWDGIFKALSEINYQGYAALESFVDITENMNTWVWRQLAPSGDVLIKEGTDFIRKMQKKYGLL